jgi:hypothetical protein
MGRNRQDMSRKEKGCLVTGLPRSSNGIVTGLLAQAIKSCARQHKNDRLPEVLKFRGTAPMPRILAGSVPRPHSPQQFTAMCKRPQVSLLAAPLSFIGTSSGLGFRLQGLEFRASGLRLMVGGLCPGQRQPLGPHLRFRGGRGMELRLAWLQLKYSRAEPVQ